MPDEREDLEDLLRHPGWAWVQQHAQKTWDAPLADYVERAANETDDRVATDKLRQLAAARKAVRQLLAAPQERLKQMLTQAQQRNQEPALSRRGSL